MTGVLRWVTYLAPAIRPLYELAVRRVQREVGVECRLHARADYAELAAGAHDFAFVCGLPYVEMVDGMVSALEPLAAPILAGPRYGGVPVYFSDVIVPARGDSATFADLRRRRWAYNEVGSHSGYLVTLHRLAGLGETTGYFGEWVDAGFHEESIRLVAMGAVDGAAVDSQVLAVALDQDAAVRDSVRVVDSLGPSTIQPLVAAPHVPASLQRDVAAAITSLGETDEERQVMSAMHVERFVPVADADYDDIRRMLAKVEMAGLWTAPRPPGLRALG
ncbi:MAG: hypothetical protein QOK05_1769 [Chloroflexota bacterium]|jgi:phosphonate transport system substrate-binding protein|nr:hypothetical protein [Chloroflexota bacterium]